MKLRRSGIEAARVCLFALAASAGVAPAQQPLSLNDAEARGQAMFDQSASTGLVIVIARNREVAIKTYGETAPGSGRNPDANSLIRSALFPRSSPATC